MEIKKTKKADLERKRPLFVQIGLVLGLSLILFAFEWKSYDRVIEVVQDIQGEIIEQIEIVQTQRNEPPPPPPAQQVTTILNIVDDKIVIDNDLEIDAEADDNVEEYSYVEVVEEIEVVEAEIFTVVEENPMFPGGDEARMNFLRENIKYPQMARESGIQGTVYVTFVVEPSGNITNIKILRGIGGGCDEEALRVVRQMPKWKPGKQRGKSVRVQFNMPIRFVLS
ncbi:MAG: energy transducer TonB [Bacteroidales bacterium]|nr:energy transducer TonB [Bacteroidales bacterium]